MFVIQEDGEGWLPKAVEKAVRDNFVNKGWDRDACYIVKSTRRPSRTISLRPR